MGVILDLGWPFGPWTHHASCLVPVFLFFYLVWQINNDTPVSYWVTVEKYKFISHFWFLMVSRTVTSGVQMYVFWEYWAMAISSYVMRPDVIYLTLAYVGYVTSISSSAMKNMNKICTVFTVWFRAGNKDLYHKMFYHKIVNQIS